MPFLYPHMLLELPSPKKPYGSNQKIKNVYRVSTIYFYVHNKYSLGWKSFIFSLKCLFPHSSTLIVHICYCKHFDFCDFITLKP